MLYLLVGGELLRLVLRASFQPMATYIERAKLCLFMLANVWILCIPPPTCLGYKPLAQ